MTTSLSIELDLSMTIIFYKYHIIQIEILTYCTSFIFDNMNLVQLHEIFKLYLLCFYQLNEHNINI